MDLNFVVANDSQGLINKWLKICKKRALSETNALLTNLLAMSETIAQKYFIKGCY